MYELRFLVPNAGFVASQNPEGQQLYLGLLPSMLADARWNQLHDAHQAGATMDGSWMRST
jgi:hypothetical protein